MDFTIESLEASKNATCGLTRATCPALNQKGEVGLLRCRRPRMSSQPTTTMAPIILNCIKPSPKRNQDPHPKGVVRLRLKRNAAAAIRTRCCPRSRLA